jgi:hypothetical protein
MDEANDGSEVPKRREMPDKELARRRAAKRALLERVAKQSAMNIGKWSRDELYDC